MQKHYLIPAEIVQENGRPLRRPKYLDDLKLNWAGAYLENKDIYVVVVNESKELKKITDLEKATDISVLDNSKKSKDKVKEKIGLDVVGDDVESIVRTEQPNFRKEELWVSD